MPIVRGCDFPDDLLYDVDSNTWYREEPDGTVRIGMTSMAVGLAGQLVAFTPKKPGKEVKTGKSCATVESGKWVGPAKSAVGGEVVAINEALVSQPAAANADPYGAGWMVVLRPENWAEVKPVLATGADIASRYEAKMAADSFAGCA